MNGPQVVGLIERRVLVDHLVDPALARSLVPDGFELNLVHGQAVVGLCLIRLTHLRPAPLPASIGVTIEAVAHRISVLGPLDGGRAPGVYVPRRDTSSFAAVVLGGRVFPGVHGPATIRSQGGDRRAEVQASCGDGAAIDVAVVGRPTEGSLGGRHQAMFDLHRSELVAWSPRRRGSGLDLAVMTCHRFDATPVEVLRAESSWLSACPGFGPDVLGSPSALIMEHIPVTWAGGERAATRSTSCAVGAPMVQSEHGSVTVDA